MYIENVLKVKNDWWRYFIGCCVVFIATQIGSIPFIIAIFSKVGVEGSSQIDQSTMMTVLGDSNLTLFYFLIPFLFGLLGLFIVVKFIHKQTFLSLTTSRKKIDFSKIVTSFLLACSIVLLSTITSYLISPEDYLFNFELKPFLILAMISILLIPIQTSFEEYIFRGYLMQGIGAIVKNKWIPLLITSLLFGFLHYWNPEIDKLGNLSIIYYVLTGLFLGVITLMDKGMELAIGFHAGNNVFISLLVTADWTVFQTNSIIKNVGEPDLTSMMVPFFIIYPLLILYFSKKYNWTDWKENLSGRIN
ncbi:MAG: CPBP family intramembrane metalloprotease [Flavobacteriaceae bacterium]|nr:CPBP family intramembrane metalloprotease [Flavobacteriaceae bacterium]